VRLKPNHADHHLNLGNTLAARGQPHEALASFERAVQLKPDFAEAHTCCGATLLRLGNFERGWGEYEWRWKTKTFSHRPFQQPLWDGSALNGRKILLHAEQGMGDILQFVRYAAHVRERGGSVVFECPGSLLPLLASCPGIDQLVKQGGDLPQFDVHASLLSLPYILHTTEATIPARIPYLFAEATLVDQWQRELSSCRGCKVGIAWQGNPKFPDDRSRSIPLAAFEPLGRIPGVHLFSLQKGFGAEQLDTIADRFTVTDLGRRLDETSGPFMDTAAVMANLDLVITADTVIMHLAGALGVPVWVALSFAPHWIWLLGRNDSPWYPTARLFCQTSAGNWDDVFARLADKLRREAGGKGGKGSL
jgi:hypothetical protein